jgi:hypothetical protein
VDTSRLDLPHDLVHGCRARPAFGVFSTGILSVVDDLCAPTLGQPAAHQLDQIGLLLDGNMFDRVKNLVKGCCRRHERSYCCQHTEETSLPHAG